MQRSFYIWDLVETDKELQRARTRWLNRGKGAVCSLNKKVHCTVRAIRTTKNKKSIDFQKKRLAPLAKRSTCSESKCKITVLNSISDPTKWYIETHNTPRHDSRATLTGVRTRLLPWFAVFVHLKVRWKRWSQLSFLVQPHAKVSPLPVNKNFHSFDGVERTLMSLN